MFEALREADEHLQEFKAFDNTIRAAHPNEVKEWEVMVETWDADKTKPCPYINDRSSE